MVNTKKPVSSKNFLQHFTRLPWKKFEAANHILTDAAYPANDLTSQVSRLLRPSLYERIGRIKALHNSSPSSISAYIRYLSLRRKNVSPEMSKLVAGIGHHDPLPNLAESAKMLLTIK